MNKERLARFFTAEAGDGEPRLLGAQCVDCDEVVFPSQKRCPACWGKTTEVRLSRTGTVYTYTEVRAGPPMFEPPYTVGYVDLPENIRILSKLRGEDVSVGDPVIVDIDVVARAKEDVLGYVFIAEDD